MDEWRGSKITVVRLNSGPHLNPLHPVGTASRATFSSPWLLIVLNSAPIDPAEPPGGVSLYSLGVPASRESPGYIQVFVGLWTLCGVEGWQKVKGIPL